MGAAPQEEEEPTADQLQALHHRACILGAAQYADHAVGGPYGRKNTRANEFHTGIPAHDGAHLSKELPGPENSQQLLTSWRVCHTAALMLERVSLAALSRYE